MLKVGMILLGVLHGHHARLHILTTLLHVAKCSLRAVLLLLLNLHHTTACVGCPHVEH